MVELIPKYRALENDKRYTIVRGGRGSAKSFHVAAFLLILTYTAGEVILFTRYTMTSAKKSIIPEFIEKMDLLEVPHDFHVADNIITNKQTGSKIIFSGIKTSSGNQTAALKSITGLTVWVLDEAEEMHNDKEFHKIDDSIRKKGGSNKVFLIINTDAIDTQHWIYKYFFRGGERNDTKYIHSTYMDNLHNLADSFIQKAEQAKIEDPEFYRINYLGEFGTLKDVVFPEGFTVYHDDPEGFDWEAIGGDFGFTDNPSTAILVRKNKNNLYLKEVLYGYGLTNQQIAERLIEYKGLTQVWDSAEKKSITELRVAGLDAYPADKKPGSVSFGLKKLQAMNIFIHATSNNLQEEWSNYRWLKKADGEFHRNTQGNRVPIKRDDHCIDAVRYVTTKLSGWA